MAGLINTNYAIKEADTPQSIQINKVNMSGVRPQFKGISNDDTFEYSDENKNKKKTALIVILSVLVAAGGGVGFLAHKGGKTLGKEAKFGEKIEQGWKELFGKGKDIKNNKPDNNRPNNNNPADNNKPPKNNSENPNETKPTDKKVPDSETPGTETPNEQLKIEDKPKTETPEVPPNDETQVELTRTTIADILIADQKLTKEEVLAMFEGEERENISDMINQFNLTNMETIFYKDGEINYAKIQPFEGVIDRYSRLYNKPKSEIAEMFKYKFKWQNYDEIKDGFLDANRHTNQVAMALDTESYCKNFSKEEIENIVNDRTDLITQYGVVSILSPMGENNILLQFAPTQSTKAYFQIMCDGATNEEIDTLVTIFNHKGNTFKDFQGYKKCILSYFNSIAENVMYAGEIIKLRRHYPKESNEQLITRLKNEDYNPEFLL